MEAREGMLIASFEAGVAFTRANVGYVHAIAHTLGGLFHTPHGVGNSMVLPHVLKVGIEARINCLDKRDSLSNALYVYFTALLVFVLVVPFDTPPRSSTPTIPIASTVLPSWPSQLGSTRKVCTGKRARFTSPRNWYNNAFHVVLDDRGICADQYQKVNRAVKDVLITGTEVHREGKKNE